MNGLLERVIAVLVLSFVLAHAVFSEPLIGRIGSSSLWGSGWIDLDMRTNFRRGDTVTLKIGGAAESIVVRFLSKGNDPNDPAGIDGGVVRVPENRVVQITLNEDHPDVIQISVHGGPNPWNLYPLGGGNGPATVLSAERIAP